jgi:hypothetical protein
MWVHKDGLANGVAVGMMGSMALYLLAMHAAREK